MAVAVVMTVSMTASPLLLVTVAMPFVIMTMVTTIAMSLLIMAVAVPFLNIL
jgi:hypothetical protein